MSVVDLGNGLRDGGCLSDSVLLAPHPGSVAVARLHTRQVLRAWNLDCDLDDAEQVVSEVVANGIQAHEREGITVEVRLTLAARDGKVLIAVRDFAGEGGSSGAIVPGRPGPDAEGGRGLLIVDALAEHWGVHAIPGGGKAVRVVLAGRNRAGAGSEAC